MSTDKLATKILFGWIYAVALGLFALLFSWLTDQPYDETLTGVMLGALSFEIADRIVDGRVQS